MSIENPKLEKITIKSIKGIANKTFNLDIYPNKPSILVAPNGFGKSSFATAFSSFNNKRLMLEDDNICQMENIEQPCIEIFHDGKCYTIDESQNTFIQTFDTYVINSSLYAKSKSQYMGGFSVATASLEIEDIEILSNIPEKTNLNYSIRFNKEQFGINGKVLPNISYLLVNDNLFNDMKSIDIKTFEKIRIYVNPVDSIKNKINNYTGTVDEIIINNQQELLNDFKSIECLKDLKNIVAKYSEQKAELSIYLECIQLVNIFHDVNYKKYLKRSLYNIKKGELDSLIKNFNTTGLELKLKEETRNHKKALVFKFPSAKRISNGQRDILTFIAKLFKAESKLSKENNLLIIDEIFDYLDDANLVSFQYYITKFIEEYKKNNRNLYCILLTHLDPEYINNFCFAKHKLQIRYLMKAGSVNQKSTIMELMKKRAKDKNADKLISTYLFHFHNEEQTVENFNNKAFYNKVYKEVIDKYLKNEAFDCLKICIATRIKIEELVYNRLEDEVLKKQFIDKHGTKEKLNFSIDNGIEISDIYFLLGIIYNDNLHWKENRDYETPLQTKLSNLVIKNMIKNIFENEGQ